MANCVSCSAPLPPKAEVCEYCGSKHDIDFHAVSRYTVSDSQTMRICPHCEEPLRTINLRADKKFNIERCEQCQGIFFDHNELAALLENTVTNVFKIDRRRLDSVNKESYNGMSKVKYVKCPECREFMHRSNYASRSGVIVDKCRDHGIWLDSGELNRLMQWKKAGGELLHEKKMADNGQSGADINEKNSRVDIMAGAIINEHRENQKGNLPDFDQDLLSSVSSLVKSLFR